MRRRYDDQSRSGKSRYNKSLETLIDTDNNYVRPSSASREHRVDESNHTSLESVYSSNSEEVNYSERDISSETDETSDDGDNREDGELNNDLVADDDEDEIFFDANFNNPEQVFEEVDSSDSENEAHWRAAANYDVPLYEGAPITLQESMLVILSLVLTHNLTDSCITDLLTLIQLHCIRRGMKKLSLYRFRQFFSYQSNSRQKHFFCDKCYKKLESFDEICTKCNTRKSRYFVTLSIEDQLAQILGREGFFELLQHRFTRQKKSETRIEDIYDGTLYQDNTNFLANPNNLSFTWFTDGVPIFKSSQTSIWPFYLRINELPYEKRVLRDNTILAALWFGADKPSPNLFLESFRGELELLRDRGIKIHPFGSREKICVRAILLCGICDLPAKSLFLNLTQFNGQFGCPTCEIETTSVELPPKKKTIPETRGGTLRVYAYAKNLIIRTLAKTLEYAQEAVNNKRFGLTAANKRGIKGVKGFCSLCLTMPDYILGTGIDSMHAIFEGVAKKLLFLWFDSTLHDMPFSLRKVTAEINNILLKLKPPKFIHRMPSDINLFNKWKASETKYWLLYYSAPILKRFMQPEYFNHYLSLVAIIATLNGNNISPRQIQACQQLLHTFVKDFERLYGLRFCSLNIHQLLHLADDVEKFGPMWGNACFSFESINGQLAHGVHGTTDVESQIIKSHIQYFQFSTKLTQLPAGELYDFATHRKKQVKIIQSFNGCHSVGTYKKFKEIPFVITEKLNIDGSQTIRQYFRILKNSVIYVSELYPRNLKTNSSCARFENNNDKKFGQIMYFFKISECQCNHEKCLCNGFHCAVVKILNIVGNLCSGDSPNANKLYHSYKCTLSEEIVLIPVENLITPCFFIDNGIETYITEPVNTREVE